MSISSSIKRGILSLPGADAASKAAAEKLLRKDYDEYHCFFRPAGLHNHLSHHILAAYDLGASASLLQAIYDEVSKIQRPIDLNENGVVPEGVIKPGEIKEDNWTKWLGDANAYSAYATFFAGRVSALGIVKTLEDYVFSPAANGNGSDMLLRLCSGLLHPFIKVGYGLEFDAEIDVASGLAEAAVHGVRDNISVPQADFTDAPVSDNQHAKGAGRQPLKGPSILSLVQQIYDSPKLAPPLPYKPGVLAFERLRDFIQHDGGLGLAELKRILSQFDPGHTSQEFDDIVEQMVFTSTLLTFGTGRKNRKPRLDFFLMHLLTSTLFVPAFFKYVPNVENKRALLRTFLQPWGATIMFRGRPRIDVALLMSYTDHPVPPNASRSNAHASAIGARTPESINPWPAIIGDALHANESHTIKSLRTLLYGATKYGTVPKGGVIGAFDKNGKETHSGMAELDGTVFVRAAGMLMDSIGWVTHGQETNDWDRSALGWDDAWKDGD